MFESKLCLFFQVAVQMSNFAIIFCKRWSSSILRSILKIVIRQKGAANFERFILQSDGKKSY